LLFYVDDVARYFVIQVWLPMRKVLVTLGMIMRPRRMLVAFIVGELVPHIIPRWVGDILELEEPFEMRVAAGDEMSQSEDENLAM
jgi:hypothetical protein